MTIGDLAPAGRPVPPLPDPGLIVDPRVGARGPALLALEDGSVYPGIAFGADAAAGGDLVVNTSQTATRRSAQTPRTPARSS